MWYTVLRIKREKMGLSIHKAADLIGVDRRTYRDWEKGLHMPRTYYQQDLIDKMGLQKEVFKDV